VALLEERSIGLLEFDKFGGESVIADAFARGLVDFALAG